MSEDRVLFQTHISAEARDLARNAVAGMQQQVSSGYSLRTFVEDALRAHAGRLAQEHNSGQPWARVDRIPTGRRPANEE
ncbi:hypothetical protein [Actinocrispum wychmicini]|uniref:Centromere-binding protein ParB C-terminal domain-containing protein n=1 Tax=Actinocrispum wychmicini TaxID=1213861 RepID=A0A4R2KEH9_9PSEU|nr:hypothetical protein [Actinocrispum wychmicini]TCO64935.1 hypothetical protein EV192_101719 [Actinocrispum wychmicini]